jgi:hypothetical protein
MQRFDLGAKGDNSYIQSRSKPVTTVTLNLIDKLEKKEEMIAKDIRKTKQQNRDLKKGSFSGTKCIGLWKEPDFWKFGLMEGCDNSYKIIGEIRTTVTHQLEDNQNVQDRVCDQKTLRCRWKNNLTL